MLVSYSISRCQIKAHLHKYVFIENDIVSTENSTIVLHLHIVFVSFSHFHFGNSFQKLSFPVKTITVFDRFCVDAKRKRKEKVVVSINPILDGGGGGQICPTQPVFLI